MQQLKLLESIEWEISKRLSPLAKFFLEVLDDKKPVYYLPVKELVSQPPELFEYLSKYIWKSESKIPYRMLIAKASMVGNLKLVRHFAENPLMTKKCTVSALNAAARRGHNAIVLFCLGSGDNYSDDEITTAFRHAAGGGQPTTMKILRHRVFEYGNAMVSAASGNHTKAMKLCRKWEKNDSFHNWALTNAARRGHLKAVKLLRNWGTIDIHDQALKSAVSNGHLSVVKQLLTPTNFVVATNEAADSSQGEITSWLFANKHRYDTGGSTNTGK